MQSDGAPAAGPRRLQAASAGASTGRPGASMQPLLSNAHLVLHRFPKGPADSQPEGTRRPETVPEDAPVSPQHAAPPQALSRAELLQHTAPSDTLLALCSSAAYGERQVETQGPPAAAELACLEAAWGIPKEGLEVTCQIEDLAVGLGMTTFIGPVRSVHGQHEAAAVIFAFRGTVLTKRRNFEADLDVWRNANRDLYFAARAIKHVRNEMVRLQKEHTGVHLGYYATGHSLGGFTAAACAVFFQEVLKVVTFESPGLTTFYHKLAASSASKEEWKHRIVNYLSVPNPINTCQKHLGSLYRVLEAKPAPRPVSLGHAVKCVVGTGMQLFNCFLAAKFAASALRRWGPRAMWVANLSGLHALRISAQTQLNQGDRKMARGEFLLRPAGLLSGLFGYLGGNGVYMATRLSLSCHEIMQQHSMFHLAQAFDPSTGKPYRAVEMVSWPRATRLRRAVPKVLAGLVIESFVPTKAAATVRNIFDRNAMIEARVRRLPGYVEVESYKESGPGARLRRYASRLVGDMQPARASMSDTDDEAMEDDDITSLASEDSEPSEAESAELWGRHLPSPFEDPTAVQARPEQPSPEKRRKEAMKRRRRDVTQQQNACRQELKRALTRVALEHNAEVMEQEEAVFEQGERQMERLLTLQELADDERREEPSQQPEERAPSRGRLPGPAAPPSRLFNRTGVPLAASGPQHPRRSRRPDFLRPPDRILEDAGGSDSTAETCRGELAMLMSGQVFAAKKKSRRRNLFQQRLQNDGVHHDSREQAIKQDMSRRNTSPFP